MISFTIKKTLGCFKFLRIVQLCIFYIGNYGIHRESIVI